MPLTYDNSRIVGGLMPSLDLGFSDNDYRLGLKKVGFSDIVTFSRASGGGRFNASGQYEWLSAGQPRFDFDPMTLEPRGILIEEQRTNLLLRSEGFQTTWTNERSSEQVDVIISPAGTLTGCKLVEDTTSTNTHLILQGVPGLSSGSTLTFSVYIKAAERTSARLQINDGSSLENAVFAAYDVSTGAVSSVQNSGTFTGASATITPVGNGWHRCSISGVATGATAVQARIFLISGVTTTYTGDGTSGIYIWGAQLEVGLFPTSYIPTTSAQVTRAADFCSVNNLSPWYRADEFTVLAEFTRGSSSVLAGGGPPVPRVVSFGTPDAGTIQLRANSPTRLEWIGFVVGSMSMYAIAGSWGTGALNKVAAAYKAGASAAVCVNAGAVGADKTVPPYSGMSSMGIGRNTLVANPAHLNGHIRRIRYIPRRISDTELQALTAI